VTFVLALTGFVSGSAQATAAIATIIVVVLVIAVLLTALTSLRRPWRRIQVRRTNVART